MKSVLYKIKNHIKNNKLFYLICLFAFFILVFTHLNTFLSNDDLPYLYYLRSEQRITNIVQVLKNQLADYKTINGRILVHSVLQTLLIFGKKLWAILNPIMIITTVVLSVNIASNYSKKQNKISLLLLGFSLFLSMTFYKNIIYWVAGSVNYIWTYALLAIFLALYYKYGFHKKRLVNMIIIFLLTALHECTMVFTICFIILNMLYDLYKNKKFNKEYVYYIFSFSGSLLLLLSPANQLRMIADPTWNQMDIIQKLLISVPVVSFNLFNLLDYQNIIVHIFIISIIISLIKTKTKISITGIFLIIINVLLIIFINNKWLYVSLAVLLTIMEYYGNIKNKRVELCIFSLASYAVVYSNIITPLYFAARPNYFFYMYMIIFILINLNQYLKKTNKIWIGTLILIFLVLIAKEVIVYNEIGTIYKIRENQIEEYKENGQEGPLVLKKIPRKYSCYHMDINLPTKEWFTYRYFLTYYGLDEDIEIKFE